MSHREGIAQEIAFWECLLCPPGTPLSLDARLTLDVSFEAQHATAEVNGASYARVFWQGDFTFSSGVLMTLAARAPPEQAHVADLDVQQRFQAR